MWICWRDFVLLFIFYLREQFVVQKMYTTCLLAVGSDDFLLTEQG